MALYVLVLAGGSGERFWPLSRRAQPKQLLRLFSEHSMLEGTLQRLHGLVPPEQVLVLTNTDQEAGVRAQVPHLPAENIVAEPAKRDTAAAIALAVGWVARRDPQATMVVLPADHLIRDIPGFQRTVQVAAESAAAEGALVTIGISPTWACPGFGYIEAGDPVRDTSPLTFAVRRFCEKPSVPQAEEFLRQGHFRWNAGMFAWSVPTILQEFAAHAPELHAFIQELAGAPEWATVVAERFPTLPKISIDYAIMEKAAKVLMVEAAFDWDDVGSWIAVGKYLPADADNNAGNVAVEAVDASGNLVYADQPTHVGLIGVKDLIVVRTGDALLVCHRSEAERIKHLVAKVPAALQ